MGKDKKSRNIHNISVEENNRIESEIRSNLRYVWQKTTAYILYYNPTIGEIEQELWKSFLTFIENSRIRKDKIKQLLLDAFAYILQDLKKSKNINSEEVEEAFINKAVENLRGILIN